MLLFVLFKEAEKGRIYRRAMIESDGGECVG
jgi:hypothetical protein